MLGTRTTMDDPDDENDEGLHSPLWHTLNLGSPWLSHPTWTNLKHQHPKFLCQRVSLLHRVNLSNFVEFPDLLAPQALRTFLQGFFCLVKI